MEESAKIRRMYWVGSGKKAKRGIATPKSDLDLIRQRLKVAEQAAKELES